MTTALKMCTVLQVLSLVLLVNHCMDKAVASPPGHIIRRDTEPPLEGDIHLIDGDFLLDGRLEVFHNGSWGTVCDDGFGTVEARVVCHQLGWHEGDVISPTPGHGPIWLDEVNCPESATRLRECSHQGWGRTDCFHDEDVGVACSIYPLINQKGKEGDLRLVKGKRTDDTESGRLEIFHSGEWGTICDDSFGEVEARVACQQIGYRTGAVVTWVTNWLTPGYGMIWLDELRCDGTETRLTDCHGSDWGDTDCLHDKDVSIECSAPISGSHIDGDIRLVGGDETDDSRSGRLEIYHAGAWGAVCSDSSANNCLVEVVCQQLGFREGYKLSYDPTDGIIWMDDVNCCSASQLVQCQHMGWGITECPQQDLFGVACQGRTGDDSDEDSVAEVYPVRLIGGVRGDTGRVEIEVDGVWGTVCDNHWDDIDAEIVCRQLGFYTGAALHLSVGGGLPILMDDVACTGTETGLSSCPSRGWGLESCATTRVAGVRCSGGYPVRLGGGDGLSEGRVEILFGRVWGTICDDFWDDADATVVCKQLGFTSGRAISEYGGGSGPILMDSVDCSGAEHALSLCSFDGWYNSDCSHLEDAGVSCLGSEVETSRRTD